MTGIFQTFRAQLLERSGYKLANREIAELSVHHTPLREIEKARAVTRLRDDPAFARGWRRRWFELGEADAEVGKCRAEQFGNRCYERGWVESVRHRRGQGWVNSKLAAEYERLTNLRGAE